MMSDDVSGCYNRPHCQAKQCNPKLLWQDSAATAVQRREQSGESDVSIQSKQREQSIIAEQHPAPKRTASSPRRKVLLDVCGAHRVRLVLGDGRPYRLALEKPDGLDVVCAVRAEAMVGARR
jgi:hypothetical protein